MAKKLEETEGAAMIRNISASDRALLMEALSAMAPLVEHVQLVDVPPLEAMERKRCTDNFQAAVALLEGSGG